MNNEAETIVREELGNDRINYLILKTLVQLEQSLPEENDRKLKEYERKKSQTNALWAWLNLCKPNPQQYAYLYDLRQQFLCLTVENFSDRICKLQAAGFLEFWSCGDDTFVKPTNLTKTQFLGNDTNETA